MAVERFRGGDSADDRSSSDGEVLPPDLLEDVLKQTLSEGTTEDVVDALRRARRDVPLAPHNDLEALTRFVMYFLKGRYRTLPFRDGALLTMSATLAQSLAEDPAAQSRLAHLWPEFYES
jgi:hypothetical protein